MNTAVPRDSSNKKISNQILLARQPIYNSEMGVFGYELLFKSPEGDQAGIDRVNATSQVITSAILGFGVEDFSSNRKLVFNVTPAFIEVFEDIPLPAEQVILDISDNCIINTRLISKLRELKKAGYGISIGGVNFIKDERLLGLADIFRVDVLQIKKHNIEKLVKYLRRFPNLSILALKVETIDDFKEYNEIGFDYFQGYFIGRPRVYEHRELTTNELSLMQLIATVHNNATTTEELETIISQEPSLSYKLIKLVNSPLFRVSRDIDSIKQAIVLLGRREIGKWASLLLLTLRVNKPAVLMEISLQRSKTCELIAEKAGISPDVYFTVGLFSTLDLLIEQPIKDILAVLPLSDEVKSAILRHAGKPGEALKCAKALEKGTWPQVCFEDLSQLDLATIYFDAVRWTNKVLRKL